MNENYHRTFQKQHRAYSGDDIYYDNNSVISNMELKLVK